MLSMKTQTQIRPIYDLVGGNLRALRCTAPMLRVEGPSGCGKTLGVMLKLHMACEMYPGTQVRVFRDVKTALNSTVIPEWLMLMGKDHPCFTEADPKNISGFQYPNGSTVIFAGLDEVGRVMGGNIDWIWVNEATVRVREETVQYLMTRFRGPIHGPYRQMILDYNPTFPSHWLNQLAETLRSVRVIVTHKDNPLHYRDGDWTKSGREYMRLLQESLTGAAYKRMFESIWAAQEGAVFPEFTSQVHDVDLLAFYPNALYDLPVIAGLDWGIADPFAAGMVVIDSEDKAAYKVAECYLAGMTTAQQVQMVAKMLHTGQSQYEPDPLFTKMTEAFAPRAIYYDPAMNNRGPRNADGAYGEPPIKKFKDSFRGLAPGDNRDRLQNLGYLRDLFSNAVKGSRDDWKYYISKTRCPKTWAEYEGATWHKTAAGVQIEDTLDADHAITSDYYCLRPHLKKSQVERPTSAISMNPARM